MALIRLCGCTGWSAPLLFANPRRQVFLRRGPFIAYLCCNLVLKIVLTPLQYPFRYPIVHVVCRNVEDIQKAVRFAKTHNLRITIKSTGSEGYGRSSAHGSFCINLMEMKYMSVNPDPTSRSEHGEVTVETGVMSSVLYEEVNSQLYFVQMRDVGRIAQPLVKCIWKLEGLVGSLAYLLICETLHIYSIYAYLYFYIYRIMKKPFEIMGMNLISLGIYAEVFFEI